MSIVCMHLSPPHGTIRTMNELLARARELLQRISGTMVRL
jgi:hypothetical protein